MVVHTANAFDWPALEAMIEALAAVKDKTGRKVHFITVRFWSVTVVEG